jgi:dissimilatory sulfite reductase related protein
MTMYTVEIQGRSVTFGAAGFIRNFDDWNEEIANVVAQQEGLVLSECHWNVIRFVRDYFRRFEIPPSPRIIIREMGAELHAYRCTYRTLKELFPKGGCKQACRLAGLPDYYCCSC